MNATFPASLWVPRTHTQVLMLVQSALYQQKHLLSPFLFFSDYLSVPAAAKVGQGTHGPAGAEHVELEEKMRYQKVQGREVPFGAKVWDARENLVTPLWWCEPGNN